MAISLGSGISITGGMVFESGYIAPKGPLYGWGQNVYTQLGLGPGSGTYYSSPKQVGALTTWSGLPGKTTGGQYHSAAILDDGTLWSWGYSSSGQLGQGEAPGTYVSSPVQVGALNDWNTVDSFWRSTMAVKTDGTLWGWGLNNFGQLGFAGNRSSPVQVGALTNWLEVSCGKYFAAAVKTDGTLWAWGTNGTGELGLGNTTNYNSPKQVGALTSWLTLACGYNFMAAIRTDGTLWTWGYNGLGMLGLGDTTNRSSPVQVGALTTWLNVSCSMYHMAAVMTDGSLWTWGYNNVGQLGLGDTTSRSSPVQVGALYTWSRAFAAPKTNDGWTAAIKTDGTIWTWGRNNFGQLGLGDTTNRSSPVQVGALTTWKTISGGLGHALGVLTA